MHAMCRRDLAGIIYEAAVSIAGGTPSVQVCEGTVVPYSVTRWPNECYITL